MLVFEKYQVWHKFRQNSWWRQIFWWSRHHKSDKNLTTYQKSDHLLEIRQLLNHLSYESGWPTKLKLLCRLNIEWGLVRYAFIVFYWRQHISWWRHQKSDKNWKSDKVTSSCRIFIKNSENVPLLNNLLVRKYEVNQKALWNFSTKSVFYGLLWW